MTTHVVLAVLLVLPTVAGAQEVEPRHATSMSESASAAASQLRTQRRCCNKKGALIGGIAGAAFGAWLVRNVCDAGSSTTGYVKYMLVMGGIGGTLGAFAERSHGGIGGHPDQRVRVGTLVTRRVPSGTITVGF
jgi:hypothetical protein